MLHILHCPLSGLDLTYISLLIISCIIEYVTNKKTLNLDLKPYVDRNQTVCAEVRAFAVLNVPSTETEGSVAHGLIMLDCQIQTFWLIWILICLS